MSRMGNYRYGTLVKQVALIGTTLTLGACAWSQPNASPAADSPTPTTVQAPRLASAATQCRVTDDDVKDQGNTITFDTKGAHDAAGDPLADVACVLTTLNAPSRVVAAMDATRALDGVQKDAWDGIDARWSYHPDSGLNLILSDSRGPSAPGGQPGNAAPIPASTSTVTATQPATKPAPTVTSPSETTTPQAPPPTHSPSGTYNVASNTGSTLDYQTRDGVGRISLSNWNRTAKPATPGLEPPSGKRWVAFRTSISNTGTVPLPFNEMEFILVDKEGFATRRAECSAKCPRAKSCPTANSPPARPQPATSSLRYPPTPPSWS